MKAAAPIGKWLNLTGALDFNKISFCLFCCAGLSSGAITGIVLAGTVVIVLVVLVCCRKKLPTPSLRTRSYVPLSTTAGDDEARDLVVAVTAWNLQSLQRNSQSASLHRLNNAPFHCRSSSSLFPQLFRIVPFPVRACRLHSFGVRHLCYSPCDSGYLRLSRLSRRLNWRQSTSLHVLWTFLLCTFSGFSLFFFSS